MKHHYNKEELIELKTKYDRQVSKEALEEIKHSIDLDKEIERLQDRINKAIEIYKECCKTQDFSTCDLDMYEALQGSDENE